MLELRAIAGPTGRLLREMLNEKGLLGRPIQGIVNYGYAGDGRGLPTLNANAGRQDKYQELVKLDEAGVRTVPFSHSAADLVPPIFGRKFHHTRGNDIFAYGVRPLLRGDHLSDYYTMVVPKQNEFRVWVFRQKHLATYEKKLEYPNKYGRRGRNKEVWNWANGFAYQFVDPEGLAPALKSLAINAVAALDLDFGGVDVILGADRRYYVLEVNTAPGTQGEPRQGMTSLVNCIERWTRNGFQARR
jgi:hypothetical protein